MSPSNHPSPAQWAEHVAQWRTSGITRSAYCTEHGLKLHSLIYWIKRTRLQPASGPALTLVQARVMPAPVKAEAPLILECRSGCRLVIPASTPAHWLGALVSALA